MNCLSKSLNVWWSTNELYLLTSIPVIHLFNTITIVQSVISIIIAYVFTAFQGIVLSLLAVIVFKLFTTIEEYSGLRPGEAIPEHFAMQLRLKRLFLEFCCWR